MIIVDKEQKRTKQIMKEYPRTKQTRTLIRSIQFQNQTFCFRKLGAR
jgi:hypothetical protein